MINKDLEYIAYHYGKVHQPVRSAKLIEGAIDSKDEELIIEEIADVVTMTAQLKQLCALIDSGFYATIKIAGISFFLDE